MPTKTVKYVNPKPREFSGKYGPSAAVKVTFDDATMGDVLTKPDSAQKHIDALSALLGKPSEFELEENGEYNGIQQFRIKGYPGKPGSDGQGYGGGGGGGRQFVSAFHQTREGMEYEQERMDRRTACMQSIASGSTVGYFDAVLAEEIYEFLRYTVPGTPKPAAPGSAPAAQPSAYSEPQEAAGNGQSDTGDTGHVRQRPNGSTADHVEEAARKKGMAWIKGWMKHNEQDPTDVGLRRYFCGCALNRDLETCKDMTGAEWEKVKKHYQSMPIEGVLNMVSHYQQQASVNAGVGEDE